MVSLIQRAPRPSEIACLKPYNSSSRGYSALFWDQQGLHSYAHSTPYTHIYTIKNFVFQKGIWKKDHNSDIASIKGSGKVLENELR